MCVSQRVFLCLEALAVVLLRVLKLVVACGALVPRHPSRMRGDGRGAYPFFVALAAGT